MNRKAFMKELEGLLQNIAPAERQEALQYYNDYFDDAGVENEQEVIEHLGSPKSIAENIINDISQTEPSASMWQQNAANPRAVASYREADASGFQGEMQQEWTTQNQNAYAQGVYSGEQQAGSAQPKNGQGLSGGVIALIVVLAVLSFPIWGGLAAGLFGLLLGLAVAWFGMIVAFACVALAQILVLLVLVVVGFMCMTVSPLSGVALIGGGFICAAVGILFLMLTVAMAGIATPAICRGIGWTFRKLFGNKNNG